MGGGQGPQAHKNPGSHPEDTIPSLIMYLMLSAVLASQSPLHLERLSSLWMGRLYSPLFPPTPSSWSLSDEPTYSSAINSKPMVLQALRGQRFPNISVLISLPTSRILYPNAYSTSHWFMRCNKISQLSPAKCTSPAACPTQAKASSST